MDSSRFEIEIYNLKVAESSHRISDPSEKQSPNELFQYGTQGLGSPDVSRWMASLHKKKKFTYR